MHVRLHLLRDRGRPIPKWQFATKQPIAVEITLREERDEVLNRFTRVARALIKPGHPHQDIPPLRDVQLVELSSSRMVLSGIERGDEALSVRPADCAQTWVCWLGDE